MAMDPTDAVDAGEAASTKSKINAVAAITIALLATFMGVCKVKDDNICQAMQQAQANKIDYWAWYQARHIRQDLAESTATQYRLQARLAPPGMSASFEKEAARASAAAAKQGREKAKTQAQAVGFEKSYDDLNSRDDQFDMSDAATSMAIALLAITVLSQRWWLYWLSLVPSFFGVLLGLAGFLGWPIHPNALARFLGT